MGSAPRRFGAGRVEKTLEEQIVGDGIDVGDARAIGHQRVGHAAPGVKWDAGLAGKARDVGHHEKEGCVAVARDGRQLAVQALAGAGQGAGAVPCVQPLPGQEGQGLVWGAARG